MCFISKYILQINFLFQTNFQFLTLPRSLINLLVVTGYSQQKNKLRHLPSKKPRKEKKKKREHYGQNQQKQKNISTVRLYETTKLSQKSICRRNIYHSLTERIYQFFFQLFSQELHKYCEIQKQIYTCTYKTYCQCISYCCPGTAIIYVTSVFIFS